MIFLNLLDVYQVKYKKERNIKYFRERFTYTDGGFATLDWYIPEINQSGTESNQKLFKEAEDYIEKIDDVRYDFLDKKWCSGLLTEKI